MVVVVLEPVLDVECRHATRACSGDRLAVDVVLDVAAGEDAVDVRRRAVVGDEVAVLVQVELSAKSDGVRRVPDRDEDAVERRDSSVDAGDGVGNDRTGDLRRRRGSRSRPCRI